VTKILYLDMDGVLVDFESGLDRVPAATRSEYQGHEDDIPGLFALMDPMPGALEAFAELAGLFDTYILSTAPWRNPSAWSDKLLWVQKHLGDAAHKRLILSHHKGLNRGDYLVDDRARHGVNEFEGEHIHFGTPEFPDWPAVVKYLQVRA
jgi:5'-nucleotidase